MMTDSSETDLPPRPAARLAFGAALLWLAAAAVVIGMAVQGGFRIMPFDIMAMATLAAGVGAPAAALLLLALVLQGGSRAEIERLAVRHARAGENSGAIRAGLTEIDAMLAGVGLRLEALRGTVAADVGGLGASAAQLETSAAALGSAAGVAHGAAQTLLDALPQAHGQVDGIATLLGTTSTEAARQLDDVETLLAGLWARGEAAQVQAATATTALTTLFADIDSASNRSEAALTERQAQLTAAIEGLFERTTTALDATRDGVHAQTNALLAAVEQARVALDHIGGEASRAIGKRLERLLASSEQFGTQLAEQDTRSRQMVDTLERSFVMLDGKLRHSATMGQTTLDDLAGRIGGLRDAIDGMATPIGSTEAAIAQVKALVADLGAGADGVVETLATTLPATGGALSALASDLNGLHAHAAALSEPVAAGHAAINDAAAAFAAQKSALDAAATQLAEQLDAARATLGEIEGHAQGSAIGAANALIEVMSRVREVAQATTGTMRSTIEGLIGEAETALERAGTDKVESAFGAPVRAQLAAIESASVTAAAAAHAAAERVTRQLLGLTQSIAAVEARVSETDTRFEARSQDDMAVRAAALIEQLNQASVDIGKRLAPEVSDASWAAYLRGDRSIFARRAVRLLDGGTARAVARQFDTNPEFAAQAAHYIERFETLLKRVRPDAEGKALAVTLVSSDIGKLYVALAQATEKRR